MIEKSSTPKKPKVAVIGTGGTISTRSNAGPLDLVNYMASGTTLHVNDLIDAVPEVRAFAEIVPIKFKAVSSTSIAFDEWKALVHAIDEVVAEHPDLTGIVILHGTATMEETAYMLHLTLKVNVPVVLVGSQRPLSALSSDAPLNFVNAVRVAGDTQFRDLGVLVCLNDEIHAAREVTKSSTYRLHTFQTPDFGALGHIDGDRISLYRRPARIRPPETEFDIRAIERLPRVDIAYAYAGDDGTVIRALKDADAKGLVIAAFPGGRLSPAQTAAAYEALEAGVKVILSTRAGSGRAIIDHNLRAMGIIAADNLNPQKARILLSLALTLTSDPDELEDIFIRY